MKTQMVALLFTAICSPFANAYKVEVHAILTDAAARRSVLSQNSTWRQLGFSGVQSSLKITSYEPESGSHSGEPGIWSNLQDEDRYGDRRVVGSVDYAKLMAFGADIEDTGVEFILDGEQNNVFLSRAFNHFYNPQEDSKLDVWYLTIPNILLEGSVVVNYTSPDWMLEDSGVIANQHFSYRDAQAHFYRVFTSDSPNDRKNAMAETIQTLGHVVHHIQDMAQPQHTRLDSHCDAGFCQNVIDEYFSHDQNDTSIYEVYTQNIIRCGESGNSFRYGRLGAYRPMSGSSTDVLCDKDDLLDWDSDWVAKAIPLDSYDVVSAVDLVDRSPRPRDFWTNENGTGIADFSSRNFVSTDTAFQLEPCVFGLTCDPDDLLSRLRPNSDELPLPNGQTDAVYNINKVQLNDLISLPSQVPNDYGEGVVSFISSSFIDQYSGGVVTNERLVSYSIFNERFTKKSYSPLGQLFGAKIFTTSYFNMDEHARLLMPRAVAYSAGLINYFFRYDLDYQLVRFEQDDSSYPLRAVVRITNNSDYSMGSSSYNILVERDNGTLNTVRIGGGFRLPAKASREFTILWPDYDYTGKISMVFFNHLRNTQGSTRAAHAGLIFDLNLPKEPDSAIPCGASINASGGSEGYTAAMSLGSESGPVQVQFEAFSIPDSLRISNSSGSTRFTTNGLVSGYSADTISYDPDSDGNLNIQVTGNSDNDTAWTLFVGCPNEGSSGSDIVRHRYNYHYSEDSFDYSCGGQLTIDGVLYDSPFDNIYLTPGDHSISATQSCSCNFSSCDYENIDGSFVMQSDFWSYSFLKDGRRLHVSSSGSLSIE